VIVDSSAVLAILFAEEDAPDFARALESADARRMSAANWLETAIRVDMGGNPIASNALDDFMRQAGVIIETVTVEQARIARNAYRAYGKGTGHPAGLNFGDCFAYALAKTTGEPLLFKGDDFSRTDIKAALDAKGS
jgi:ribonuclease VapC